MHKALIPAEHVDDFIIVRAIAFTTKVQRAMTRDVLRDENLPLLEWRLLFSIARFGSCHLAYVTRRTSVDPAHGSRAATNLEEKGLITRRDDPENKRRKIMSLTPNGVEVFERIWPRAQKMVRTVTDQLDPQDFQDFKRLVGTMNDAAEVLVEDNNADIGTSTITREDEATTV
ncbi:MAG: MarR family winged helix-turn-helix transcriptional regulator [Pikeienuella sp.]